MTEFEDQNQRKSHLLNLFDRLETENLRARARRRYERVVKQPGTVRRIGNAQLLLEMENGEMLNSVIVTHDIAASLKPGDVLSGGFGKVEREWDVIFIDWIASPVPGKPGQHHISIANPATIDSEIRR